MYGDAFRSAAVRLGKEAVDIIPFFQHCDKLFADLHVPDDLCVKLLRPYLNEHAQLLLSRMDVARAANYRLVKEYLLHEFQLSPRVYLERFNSLAYNPSETCLLYSSRLKGLFEYYLSSRSVSDFDALVSLFLADRIKQSLSDGCIRHLLSVEASAENGWLPYDKLAEVVDTY